MFETLTLIYLLAVPAALTLGLVCVRLAMAGGNAWGLIDQPGPRKVHSFGTPRTGGMGFALAATLVAAIVLLWLAAANMVSDDAYFTKWLTLAIAAWGMLAVGVVDDAVSLPGHYKLLALIAAALALCGADVRLSGVNFNPDLPGVALGWYLSWPLTVMWVCGVTVSIAFSDGLDGLAGGIGLIAAATIALLAGLTGQNDVAIVALSLAGALGAFLVFNGPWRSSARVFMGDGGSMFLGVVLAALPLMLNGRDGVGTMRALIVPAIVLGIPICDTALTLIRRKVLQRRSLFAAEDGHVHHRLLAIGLSTRHAVIALWGVTLIATTIALLATLGNGWASLGFLALLIPLWVGLFRTAGSMRGRETIAAVRRHRASGRLAGQFREAFEEAQLHLRQVGDFGDWWREICAAAAALDFRSLELKTTRRDGERYELRWDNPAEFSACNENSSEHALPQSVDVTIDVPQRRLGEASTMKLAASVRVGCNTGVSATRPDHRAVADLETAGRRITWFNRLLSEHGLATLDDEDRVRWHKAHRQRQAWRPQRSSLDDKFPTAAIDRPADEPRVAIVHDFLYVYAGAEKVLEQMLEVFPHADLFSVIDFIPPADRAWLKNKPVTTTFIQKLPLARYKHRAYLPLMPLAIEQLDVGAYDVVLSSSYCVAKGVICRPDQLHVSYCHSPVRFAWDLQGQYLAEAGLSGSRNPIKLLKNLFARSVLHYLRGFDARSANGVDVFLANSDYIGRRIEKTYRRESETVYPPVDVEGFECFGEKQGYFFTSSRMVPYKKMSLIVEAFTRTPERRLVVSGDGPEFEKIKRLAGPNVNLVGHQPREKFIHYMQRARAFVFAAEEDFGIVPVEAMACGTPVIAYGRGGTTETVVDGTTGVLFDEQTVESLLAAVERFEQIEAADGWDHRLISRHVEQFGVERFRGKLRTIVLHHWHARSHHSRASRGLATLERLSRRTIDEVRKDAALNEYPVEA